MSYSTYKDINIFTAAQFKESVSEAVGNTKIYLTYGYSSEWSNEAAPDTATACDCSKIDVWNRMIGGKRVTGNDVEHVIQRFDWTSNTNYIAYDHQNETLREENVKFFVLTSDNHVYKCLGNNNNSISLVEPTATNPNTVTQTADGYLWKYLYSLNSEDIFRFKTSDYIPVRTLTEDNGSDQWDVQQGVTDGAIYYISIDDAGNYTNTDNITITISGDGSGANAYANVNTTSNTLHTITIDDFGTGYTNASVTISGGGGTGGGSLRPIISPTGGHGSNPLYELGGNRVMINMRLNGSEGEKFPTVNDFRRVALVANPLKYSTPNVFSNSVFTQLTTLTLTGVSGTFTEDETVYQGTSLATATFHGNVVEWDSANSKVKLNKTVGSPSSDTIVGETTGVTGFVTSITLPELEKNTGIMFYNEHFTKIERDPNQTENFQIVMKF
jgi:hypothetical protein